MGETERWRDIPGYEGCYQLSDKGRVKSLARDIIRGRGGLQHQPERILKPGRNGQGYLQVALCRDAKVKHFRIHRLVLEVFVGPAGDGMQACHNDGSRTNNDVRNLRWDTPKANQADRYAHGTQTNAQKTHCKRGHPFDLANTYYPPAGPTTYKRYCRTCGRLSKARRKAEQNV